jgi:hypothetical protein
MIDSAVWSWAVFYTGSKWGLAAACLPACLHVTSLNDTTAVT